MKKILIKDKWLNVPIIQGGMGIGVSLGNLAGHVMLEGGMGTISAANPGFKKPDFFKKPLASNLQALKEEIEKAREIAKGHGLLAVNVMVKGTNYASLVRLAVANKVDAIICGAGLPLELPKLVKGSNVAIAPIVSSAKAAMVICRSWERKHDKYPDFVVIEGPKAGGHLGYTEEDLETNQAQSLEDIFFEVKQALKSFEEKAKRFIPIFVAGGIYDGKDIKKYLELGANGVQMGTRFIGTHECDASVDFKRQFILASEEDIILTKSPAGLPGRVIRTSLTDKLGKKARINPKWCVNCLETCEPKTTIYCISEGLINAVNGEIDEHALVFSGINGWRINELQFVKDVFKELTTDVEGEVNG